MIGKVYLDRYQAIEVLGEGGMGTVYLGRDRQTAATVVIKVMREELAGNRRARNDFANESRLMTAFRHRYAVSMLDASSETDHDPCIVMEFVPGITLDDLLTKQKRLDPGRVGKILGQVCLVLQAAHQAQIIHRDLTADNIMIVAPGTPHESIKVMDFGLAHIEGYISFEKLTGDINSRGGGTPDYVSPEQLRGESVDHRADLYSVGVLLYRMLTGLLPFPSAESSEEIVYAHLEMQPPPFHFHQIVDVPSEIEGVVMSCLQKQPSQRPQSAYELADLYGAALGEPIYEPDRVEETGHENATPPYPTEHVVANLQAWMPEQIAAWKLRGFVESVQGEIVESRPGLVRISLPQETQSSSNSPKNGLLNLFGFGTKTATPQVKQHQVDLLMLREDLNKSKLEIVVVWNSLQIRDRYDHNFQQRMLIELRSYLMGTDGS